MYGIVHRFTLSKLLLFLQAKSPATQTHTIARTKINLESQELRTTLSFCILPTHIFSFRSESECFVAIKAATAYQQYQRKEHQHFLQQCIIGRFAKPLP